MEIISLRGETVFAANRPNKDVIGVIEEILELAKRGEIDGIHFVLVHDDGIARKGGAGRTNYSAIGALTCLIDTLIKEGID